MKGLEALERFEYLHSRLVHLTKDEIVEMNELYKTIEKELKALEIIIPNLCLVRCELKHLGDAYRINMESKIISKKEFDLLKEVLVK